jgi:hypothetical protein
MSDYKSIRLLVFSLLNRSELDRTTIDYDCLFKESPALNRATGWGAVEELNGRTDDSV